MDPMPEPAFVALLGSLAACVWVLARRPHEGLGLPVVALMSFGFLYVIEPLFLARDGLLDLFLTDRQVAKAFLWPALALPAFVWGWTRARNRGGGPVTWDAGRLWWFGLFSAVAGLVLYSTFIQRSGGFPAMFNEQHGGAGAWGENTAYLYLGPWWTITGVAAMFLAACRIPGQVRRWFIPGAFTATMWLNAVLVSSRTFLFATTAAAAASIAMGKGWRVTLGRAAPVVLAVGAGVLAVLGFRSVLHLGDIRDALPETGAALTAAMHIDPLSAVRRITGNEFVVHASVLDTVDATGKYDYGLNWAFVYLVHPIPRTLWPGKPYRFQTPGIQWSDVYAHTGVAIAGGASPGIVADLYSNIGVVSIVIFGLFGLWSGRLYRRALTLESPLASIAYLMLLATSLNGFAQGFGAILVPFPYAIAPMLLFAVSQKALASRPGPRPHSRGARSAQKRAREEQRSCLPS